MKAQRAKRQSDWDYDMAKRMLLKTGEVQPCFMVHGADHSYLIGVPFNSDERKTDVANMIRLFALAKGADAISFMSEAWVRHLTKAHNETEAAFLERAEAILPSQAEDRREMVVVELFWRDDNDKMHNHHRHGEIDRDASGKAVGLINEETASDDEAIGRFTHLVPPRKPTPAQREMAQTLLPMLFDYLGLQMEMVREAGHA